MLVRLRSALTCFAILPLVLSESRGSVLRVPQDFADIQSAIAATSDGDTVLVSAGTYSGAIDFVGKNILVASIAGPEVTIIAADPFDAPSPVVTFQTGETDAATLQGFTVRDGRGLCIDPGDGTLDVYGGGILVRNGAGPTISGNVITDNTATGDCTFARRGGAGIAVLADASATTIVGNVISSNELIGDGPAGTGGGIYYACPLGGELIDNTITANRVEVSSLYADSGGGIWITSIGDSVIEGNIIDGNTVPDGRGGGISGAGTIKRNVITGNQAMYGGGIAGRGSGVVALNLIEANEASVSGGGLDLAQSTGSIRLNTICGNFARSGAGIAILGHSGYPEIRRNRILRNHAIGRGGGILARYWNFEITNNLFIGNTAGRGGAVAAIAQAQPFKVPGLFAHNTLYANTAATEGGALLVDNESRFFARSSILWGNSAPTDAAVHAGTTTVVRVEYCDVQGGWPGPGNIDSDPLFRAPADDDLRLRGGSPCVDGATPAFPGMPSIDLDGDPRPIDAGGSKSPDATSGGARADIGADEWGPADAFERARDSG